MEILVKSMRINFKLNHHLNFKAFLQNQNHLVLHVAFHQEKYCLALDLDARLFIKSFLCGTHTGQVRFEQIFSI